MAYKQQSPIPLAEGGTNALSFGFDNGVVVIQGSGQISISPGLANQVLMSNGVLLPPTFQTISNAGAVTSVSGNAGSATPSSGVLTISGSGPISTSGASSTLSLTTTAANVIHSTSGDATASSNAFTIVGSGTVSTSATGSTVTITGLGGGTTWNDQTTTTVTMAVNNAYSANNAGLVTLTLPSTAVFGSIVQVSGNGAGGWLIAQNSGQTIHFGAINTTTGVGGSLASTSRYDQVTLVCSVANTDWVVNSSLGMITYV